MGSLVTITDSNIPPALPAQPIGKPVALVCMPWGSVKKPSLAVPLLKRYIEMAGFEVDVHLVNIRMAEYLGIPAYEALADRTLHPEWFFAQALYKPGEPDYVETSWQHLRETKAGRDFTTEILNSLDGSEELCLKIVGDYVPRLIEDCMTRVDWSRYMIVGFTTTFAQSLASALLAKRIKQAYPGVKIIFGGANVDSEMGIEFMKAFEWIDYVAHGEAENTFPRLLHNLANGKPFEKVPGISVRIGADLVSGAQDRLPFVDLNEAPVPDYSDYVRELERAKFKTKIDFTLFFESSRGCWWGAKQHCTFCGLNGTGMAYRRKDAKKIYNELMELSSRYRCLSFCAADNILPVEYFSQLLPELAEADTDLSLFYEVKANMSRDHVKALSKAGIRTIQPGIESFNTRLLALMRKGVKAIQNIQLLKWCYEYRIQPNYNILYGFPGENAADYADYPRLFRLMSHLPPPGGLNPILFERFSPYHFDRDRFGLTLRPLPHYQLLFRANKVSLDRLAYYFEGEWTGQQSSPHEYIAPTLEAWEVWKKRWDEKNIYCYYHKGPHYVVIFDNRRGTNGIAATGRRVYLDEPLASMYLFCDENRGFQAIRDHVKLTLGDSWTDDRLRYLLDQLVTQGFMYREETRYLSLATRKRELGLPVVRRSSQS
ncbi:MAG TPA: RiPP maturation radical SAM C-methyltransferase [Bryobacteraceae bacterium]|jgi:ribosomal peptide maturation radical SAM protein 1|nr:RiPP maturation radical SAM C-methyltransferase [Bryobacteraceae bacterium]